MALIERDQVVQTLAPNGADQALAESVGLGGSGGGADGADAEALQREIEIGRKDGVAVVDHDLVRMVEDEELADGPQRARLARSVLLA